MQNKIRNNIEVSFFDIDLWFGNNIIPGNFSIPAENLKSLLAERKKSFNISNNVISNFLSIYSSPEKGNEETGKLIEESESGQPGVFGTLFMEKRFFIEPLDFGNWIESMYGRGFRLFRLMPKTQKYPYDPDLFSQFYEVLNFYCFPVLISIDEINMENENNTDWARIIEIIDSYENIPLIIEGGLKKNPEIDNYLFSILNNTDNVFLEIHNLNSSGLLENLVKCGGSRRLVYGSCFPYFDTHATTAFLRDSSLKMKDKINISSGNIKKIFDEIAI